MQPDRVFDFEPPQARNLEWLPLAVRYKLDLCELKIGLKEWQAIPLEQRDLLVRCAPGALFDHQLRAMVPTARKLPAAGLHAPPAFDNYVAARIPA